MPSDIFYLKMQSMVEVFKSNVDELEVASTLIEKLHAHFPQSRVNFDLSDCDKILRVEAEVIYSDKIIELVKSSGYQLEVL
jgi:hypothetical protein